MKNDRSSENQKNQNAHDENVRKKGNSEDENLLIAYRKGDEKAFDTIISKYGNQLYNFILRLVGSPETADDVFQDTFVRVLRNIERYKPNAKLLTWLIQIAKNLCYDHFKKESIRSHHSLSNESSEEYSLASIIEDPGQDTPQDLMILEEDKNLVREAIELLSAKKKEVILLRIYEGLPYRDISEITGDPEGTLKYRVYEAVREIAAYIEKKHTPK